VDADVFDSQPCTTLRSRSPIQSAEMVRTLVTVVGARPNFMKVAPILQALDGWNELQGSRRGDESVRPILVHTGQHYDARLSDIFIRDLGLPQPDFNLGVGSGSHAQQTAAIMVGIEPILLDLQPNLVVVVGDVNSTLAAALTAAKLHLPVAHVEAGLRSGDRRMPEEVNRILTDHVSDLLFTTCTDGDANLMAEGIDSDHVHMVGNPMIDVLERAVRAAEQRRAWQDYGLAPHAYALVTLHRPENVDSPAILGCLLDAVSGISNRLPVVFPMHPRTRQVFENRPNPRGSRQQRVIVVDPLGYLDFLSLMAASRLVVTDSGGVQEETTALGIPCITARTSTERPITIREGTNCLAPPDDPQALLDAVDRVLDAPMPEKHRPPLWDGHAGERIVAVIGEWLRGRSDE